MSLVDCEQSNALSTVQLWQALEEAAVQLLRSDVNQQESTLQRFFFGRKVELRGAQKGGDLPLPKPNCGVELDDCPTPNRGSGVSVSEANRWPWSCISDRSGDTTITTWFR